jgi:transcriptional regulator, AraC family
MTISAQVIDTIVEWIDDNLHQPLRIDDIARHAGYSKMAPATTLFAVQRRESGALYTPAQTQPGSAGTADDQSARV